MNISKFNPLNLSKLANSLSNKVQHSIIGKSLQFFQQPASIQQAVAPTNYRSSTKQVNLDKSEKSNNTAIHPSKAGLQVNLSSSNTNFEDQDYEEVDHESDDNDSFFDEPPEFRKMDESKFMSVNIINNKLIVPGVGTKVENNNDDKETTNESDDFFSKDLPKMDKDECLNLKDKLHHEEGVQSVASKIDTQEIDESNSICLKNKFSSIAIDNQETDENEYMLSNETEDDDYVIIPTNVSKVEQVDLLPSTVDRLIHLDDDSQMQSATKYTEYPQGVNQQEWGFNINKSTKLKNNSAKVSNKSNESDLSYIDPQEFVIVEKTIPYVPIQDISDLNLAQKKIIQNLRILQSYTPAQKNKFKNICNALVATQSTHGVVHITKAGLTKLLNNIGIGEFSEKECKHFLKLCNPSYHHIPFYIQYNYDLQTIFNKLQISTDITQLEYIIKNIKTGKYENFINREFIILAEGDLHMINLTGVDLHGADLRGLDLAGVDLTGANLADADMRGANLSGANLSGANLQGVNLENANLRGTNLERANLKRANLEKADLTSANLKKANFTGANLEGAQLIQTYLNETNLMAAYLANANLERSVLYKVNLEGANLKKANLEKITLTHVNLKNANLEGANLNGAHLNFVCLIDAYGVDLTKVFLVIGKTDSQLTQPKQITDLIIPDYFKTKLHF